MPLLGQAKQAATDGKQKHRLLFILTVSIIYYYSLPGNRDFTWRPITAGGLPGRIWHTLACEWWPKGCNWGGRMLEKESVLQSLSGWQSQCAAEQNVIQVPRLRRSWLQFKFTVLVCECIQFFTAKCCSWIVVGMGWIPRVQICCTYSMNLL